jgi:hypothetical protein
VERRRPNEFGNGIISFFGWYFSLWRGIYGLKRNRRRTKTEKSMAKRKELDEKETKCKKKHSLTYGDRVFYSLKHT